MKRRDLRVVRGEAKYNFNTGAVVESLQGAGVPTDQAIGIARGLEKHYRQEDEESIELDEMVKRLARVLQKDFDDGTAERFRRQTPPFVQLSVQTDDGEKPFSRRMLAGSLQKIDLSFKEAHAVARQVEQALRTEGRETITERDLAHMVAVTLEMRLGRDLRLKYEAQTHQTTDLYVVGPDEVGFPFSRGILAQSLMSIGLGPELSHMLAKQTEDALWRMGESSVDREAVRRVVRSLLLQEAGEEFARRYELMRSLRRPERPIVVLLGGAPGVGKSSLAAELGYRLGIPRVVSSDSVRQALRSLISPELSPSLHASSFTAWRAELMPGEADFVKPKRKRVIRGFQRQVQQLVTAMTAIVMRNIEESTSVIMEGIHLVPGFMPGEKFEGGTVVEFAVAVPDAETHRKHFDIRDAQTQHRRSLEAYMEHFDEIRMLQDFIVARAEDEGVPIIDVSDFDRAVDQAIEHILDTVLVEQIEMGDRKLERDIPL